MSSDADTQLRAESSARLRQAERRGLRLAIACRTVITGLAFAWYVGAPLIFPGFAPRFAAIVILLVFTAIGVAHLLVIGTRYERWWMKYGVYTLDTLSICAAFALVPISRADDVPQIIAFRAYGIYYLFPMVALACLSLSWRLVIWTGAICVIGWWAAFSWVAARTPGALSWGDIPSDATRADYERIFLSIDFIGRGNRIEETAMLMFAALVLALAVYRARAVFFAQVAADVARRRERSLRERVSGLLGKYVPEEIAERLIADETPLAPQRATGTALVMDIAGFTRFSAAHPPEHVIAVLDRFLAEATEAASRAGGVVITYLGDGFLVTFNAPVSIADPAAASLVAAERLIEVAGAHGFDVRIGIASGDLVTGTIGTDQRQSFTVYGDAVNLAARLEALGKTVNAQILVDRATRAAAPDLDRFSEHSELRVHGLERPMTVYSVRPPAPSAG